MKRLIFLPILIGLMCGACSKKSPVDAKFEEINMLCDTDSRLAMSMLDSIDYGVLSTAERHRYDLLSIKSRDKAYVRHTSDSLILDVVEYYDGHRKSGLYPEALYYGGRVYSDIGDLPTALSYFQKTIDVTPDDKEHRRFKRNVMDQTGRLLQSLRLDSAAIRYLEKSLILNDILKEKDSRVAFTHVLLGSSYQNIHDIRNARLHIDKAITHSSDLSAQRQASILINLADILAYEGKLDSALAVIRPLPFSVDSLALSQCLSLASEIYRDAGILDTAYMYARQLTKLKDPRNKRTGYKVIFSEKLRNQVPKDTLIALISEYKSTIEEYMDNHEGENAIVQNTKYNYSQHQRQRERAIEEKLEVEKDRNIILIVCSAIILILIVVIFRIYHTNIKNKLKLMLACQLAQNLWISHKLDSMSDLRESVYPDFIEDPKVVEYLDEDYNQPSQPTNCIEDHTGKRLCLPFVSQKAKLRKELLDLLREIIDDKDSKATKDNKIQNSTVVKRLKKMLTKNKGIRADDHAIWLEIEKTVHASAPEFKSRLMILSLDQMSKGEYHAALLTRCGFRPKEISDLLCLGKSGSSDRRRNLANKIFQGTAGSSDLDRLIFRL